MTLIKNKKKFLLLLIIFVLTALFCPWFWRILEQNIFLAVFLFILGLFITAVLVLDISNKVKLFVYSAVLLVGLFLVATSFDVDIFKQSGIERSTFEQRKHLAHGVNKIFVNRGYDTYLKVQRNFLTNVDFNQYFFGGAPRYRNFAGDFEKFPYLFLPFFLYGILLLMKDIKKHKAFIYTTICLLIFASFTRLNSLIGLYSLFPIILSLIVYGFFFATLHLFKFIKRNYA